MTHSVFQLKLWKKKKIFGTVNLKVNSPFLLSAYMNEIFKSVIQFKNLFKKKSEKFEQNTKE